MAEPCYDVAHLGHVELLTDQPDESLDFFVNVYGLTESGREGDFGLSARLRRLRIPHAEADRGKDHRRRPYRLSLRQSRRRSSAASTAIEALGCGIGWTDGDLGHGRAYRFNDPDGHVFEVYYDTAATRRRRARSRR